MRRSSQTLEYVCTWCNAVLVGDPVRAKTLPEFTRFRSIPAGTLVAVCGKRCPKRPAGAPVGSRLANTTESEPAPGRLFDLVAA